ncbi:MAG: 4-(cytidine 5'-diphospho)-2-C-methyl-D-erythritol kinase [Phycisphaerales bacterium]
MPRVVRVRCHAKVNLALAVGPPLGPEAGAHAGFHPICSWFSAIDLWDDLEIEAGGPGDRGIPSASTHEITWAPDAPKASPIDWAIERDLAVRAHRLMEEEAGRALPLSMRLSKRIPVGGGLGGGSSDAAGMLRAVNEAFALGIAPERLMALARRLGSDVAYFLDGELAGPPRAAIVSGVGDRIERVPFVPAWMVLIVPGFGCPTGAVYRAFDGRAASGGEWGEARARGVIARSIETGVPVPGLFNDLFEPACAAVPELRHVSERAAAAAGCPVFMSGSGSTLFTLHGSESEAGVAAARLRADSGLAAAVITSRLVGPAAR